MILIVDDEQSARAGLASLLKTEGYETCTAANAFEALSSVAESEPDLVLTDLKMPGMSGTELLGRVREQDAEIPVVLMTAFGDVENAVAAMRAGAADYLTKPLHVDQLLIVLERALDWRRLRRSARELQSQLHERYSFENIIGSSPQMQRLFKTIVQVAGSTATVLLSGASGTGKELVAAAIHQRSARSAGPYVRLHCAALAESLLESELFGHERGAFTGADRRRVGRFELAEGGTLFLDEIGEISPATQVKLLRVLQERQFERVGGNETLHVDVRVLAATNRDLKQMVRDGQFREDLYYRLNVVHLTLPPLRERSSDIPALAAHFLERSASAHGRMVSKISPAVLALLMRHSWPGNVRELENVIERAVVMATGDTLEREDLPAEFASVTGNAMPAIPGARLSDLERYAILGTLEAVAGSVTKAASLLGISRRKIHYKLQEYARASAAPGTTPSAGRHADSLQNAGSS